MSDALFQKEAAEDIGLLLHQNLCHLHCRGYDRPIRGTQQGCNKAGDRHICQPPLEHGVLAIVQCLTNRGKGLAPDLPSIIALVSVLGLPHSNKQCLPNTIALVSVVGSPHVNRCCKAYVSDGPKYDLCQ